MQTEQLRIGLVGCGRVAQAHIAAAAETPAARIVAVADPAKANAASVAEQLGLPRCYTGHEQMASEEQLDAAIVCSPPNTHAAVAADLLQRGVHVLCEKPFTITSRDALRLTDVARRKRRVLMMASKFRYVEDLIKARALLQSGMLGEVVLFELAFCSRLDMRHRWNADKEVSGGGVLMDNGPHAVDVARYLLGPIDEVRVAHARRTQDVPVEDTCLLQFRSRGGVLGNVALSWSVNRQSDYFLEVNGTEGTLQIGWRDSRSRQVEKADWVRFGNGYDKGQAFRQQLRNFLGAVQGVEQPLISMDEAVESVRAIEVAYDSVATNGWLPVRIDS